MALPSPHSDDKPWTFLTYHARVLIHIARNPSIRQRDIATEIGITEHAAQIILDDLEEAGYIARTRVGRRNRYTVDTGLPFRHPVDADQNVQALISVFVDRSDSENERGLRHG